MTQRDPTRKKFNWRVDSGRNRPSTAALVAIFSLGSLIIISYGWYVGCRQHHALQTFLPIPARVISSSFSKDYFSGSTTSYDIDISYEYSVAGKSFTSGVYRPSGSNSCLILTDAKAIVAKYPLAMVTTAWYDPANPADSFLVRDLDGRPYTWALLFAPVLVGCSFYYLFALHNRRNIKLPVPDGASGYRVPIDTRLRHGLYKYLLATLAWYAYFAVALGDYLHLQHSVVDWRFVCGVIYCLFFGLIGIFKIYHSLRLNRDFDDATIHIARQLIRPGDELQISFRLPVRRSLQIKDLLVGVECVSEKPESLPEVTWDHWTVLHANRRFQSGSEENAQTTIMIPPDAHPSTPPRRTRAAPCYRWRIALKVTAENQPKLELHYPIAVEQVGL